MNAASEASVVRQAVERGWNQRNVDAFDELYAPEFVNRDPQAPDDTDLASLKRSAAELFAAFPDFHVTINDMISEGDRVAKVWTAEGSHQGTIFDIPATGRRVKFDGITIYRVVEGKIVENIWSMDTLGLLKQLGAIPTPEASPAGGS